MTGLLFMCHLPVQFVLVAATASTSNVEALVASETVQDAIRASRPTSP